MSKLKTTVVRAVAAALALSAGTTAMAATDILTGPSDLFIAVWNPVTSKSYVQDLGTGWTLSDLNGSTFNSNSATHLQITLDGGNLATDLGGSSGLDFALFAGDMSVAGQSFNAYTGNSLFLSQTSTLGGTLESNGSIFDNAGITLATYVEHNLGSANSFLTGDDHGAGSKYWAAPSNVNAPGSNFTIGGFQGAASGSGQLTLLKYLGTTENAPDNITPTFVGNTAHAGLFSLADVSGILSYDLSANGTTTTPLPAAGWLLVSGLLGLGAVGRRRKAVVAA